MTEKRNACWPICWMLINLLPSVAVASSTVTMRATIIVPACTINGSRPVDVDFGDVSTDRVNGVNYAQPLNFTLNCTGLTSPALKVQLTGTGAVFDSTSLRTSVTDLGVAFTDAAGNRMALNADWLNFTYPSLPVVKAVPVMRPGGTLPAGGFTAAATLVIEQQ